MGFYCKLFQSEGPFEGLSQGDGDFEPLARTPSTDKSFVEASYRLQLHDNMSSITTDEKGRCFCKLSSVDSGAS